MTSEPRSSNASSASSARSQATVRGVGTPAAASSAEARNLSIVCSIASAPLTARTPTAASACSVSTRKTICSSEPRGIARTITTSHASSATSRERTAKPPSIRPTIRVTGAKAHSCPRALSACSSRSACQPPVEPMTATRTEPPDNDFYGLLSHIDRTLRIPPSRPSRRRRRRGHERPGRAALVEQLDQPRRLAAVDHPGLDAGRPQRGGQMLVDARAAAARRARRP